LDGTIEIMIAFTTFDRLKSKGLAAYQNGEYLTARTYLIDAAECMIELAEKAKSPEVRRQHEEIAAELIELAKEAEERSHGATKPRSHEGRVGTAHQPGRPAGPQSPRGKQRAKDDDDESDAEDWLITNKPTIGFDDIAGLDDVKTEIRLKMIYPFSRPDLAKQYGITSGGGVLLYGPPGTGKTMIAKAIAHEIDAAFYLVSPAQIMSKWVGEAEQNIRKLFEAAKAQPMSVIFLDEVEALVPKRHHDSSTVMQRVVPQILQELEGFDRGTDRALLFVGATNKPWMLDEALMRPGRMDARIYVPLPDAPARFKLLEIHLSGRPLGPDIDFGHLCDRLAGYSGADIKAIALQAAQRPFLEAVAGAEPRPIAIKDILAEIEETLPSVHASDLTRYEKFAQTGQ